MKKYILYFVTITILGVIGGCSEDNLKAPMYDPGNIEMSDLDLWFKKEFVDPYNIEILYKWKDIESDLGHNLTPPTEDKAQGFAKALKQLWCLPYIEVAGETFFKSLSPKQFLLIGSIKYNSSGTYTKGTAEAGRKIVIYEIDEYDRKNATRIKRYMKTVHHEFAHIADQTKEMPKEWERITPEYADRWDAYSDSEALELGFITNYAMSLPSEDFAEMVGMMLSNSRAEWTAILEGIENKESAAKIKEKEDMVVAYYKGRWNVDLYALQLACEEALEELISN